MAPWPRQPAADTSLLLTDRRPTAAALQSLADAALPISAARRSISAASRPIYAADPPTSAALLTADEPALAAAHSRRPTAGFLLSTAL